MVGIVLKKGFNSRKRFNFNLERGRTTIEDITEHLRSTLSHLTESIISIKVKREGILWYMGFS